jgi:hypothetical protein
MTGRAGATCGAMPANCAGTVLKTTPNDRDRPQKPNRVAEQQFDHKLLEAWEF